MWVKKIYSDGAESAIGVIEAENGEMLEVISGDIKFSNRKLPLKH